MLAGKNIILGVSGSIAAYKAAYLLRLCTEAGAEVWPVMTRSATRFLGPLTLSALSGHRTIVDLWSHAEAGEVTHVHLGQKADALVLAPATAQLMQRLARGSADDPLSAIALSTQAPSLIAPAMEDGMWNNPTTQAHVEALRQRGSRFVAPTRGPLASGASGAGRMAEPETIFRALQALLTHQDLAGKRVVVTAGPTQESLDPVRFLSNHSSGRMGLALAEAAAQRGAEVHLVLGPTQLAPQEEMAITRVRTTQEMLEACRVALRNADIWVMAAAPADYRPREYNPHKLKKSEHAMSIDFESTPDILKTLRKQTGDTIVVGFAAESQNLQAAAETKLKAKGLDLIVANDITQPGAGFGSDTNQVIMLSRQGHLRELAMAPKRDIAHRILDAARELADYHQ